MNHIKKLASLAAGSKAVAHEARTFLDTIADRDVFEHEVFETYFMNSNGNPEIKWALLMGFAIASGSMEEVDQFIELLDANPWTN